MLRVILVLNEPGRAESLSEEVNFEDDDVICDSKKHKLSNSIN